MLLTNGIVFSATEKLEALYHNIKIFVDGAEIIPKDANGNTVEPFIVNGTTYLPVRAIATALGKEVYWDGPNYTVYLGDMKGKLEYPTTTSAEAVIQFSADTFETIPLIENTTQYKSDGSIDSWTEYTYNDQGNRLRSTYYNGNGSFRQFSEYTYISIQVPVTDGNR